MRSVVLSLTLGSLAALLSSGSEEAQSGPLSASVRVGLVDPVPTLALLSTDPLTRAHSALYDALMIRPVQPGMQGRLLEGLRSADQEVEAAVKAAFTVLDEITVAEKPGAGASTVAAIVSGAEATGVSSTFLLRTAVRESGLRPIELWGIHPEAAQRVDLSRYQSFHMERLSATDGIYCFYGKSRDIPDD